MSKQMSLIDGVEAPVGVDHYHREELAVFELALEGADYEWAEGFVTLCQQVGMRNWRKAAFIAWSAIPEGVRVPSDKKGLAVLLGLKSPRVLSTWGGQPSTQALLIQYSQATLMMKNLAAVDRSLAEEAVKPGMSGYQHKKLFYQRVGITNDAPQVVINAASAGAEQVKGLSDAELLQAVGDDLEAIEGEWEEVVNQGMENEEKGKVSDES